MVVLADHADEGITQPANEHYGRTTHAAYVGMFREYLTAFTADPIGTLKLAGDVPLAGGRDTQATIEAAEVDALAVGVLAKDARVSRYEHKVSGLWTWRRPTRYRRKGGDTGTVSLIISQPDERNIVGFIMPSDSPARRNIRFASLK